MSSKKLTILFTPLDAWGHINCCHGLAEELIRRGHRVVFAIDVAFKGKLSPYGIKEMYLSIADNGDEEYWPKFMEENAKVMEMKNPVDVMNNLMGIGFGKQLDNIKEHNGQYKAIIETIDPHLIVTDNYLCSPAITNCGRPWVWLYSAAPLGLLQDPRLPPFGCGLPIDSDKNLWAKNIMILKNTTFKISAEVNAYLMSEGAPTLEPPSTHPRSPYLNIYLYPRELDYTEAYPLPDNMVRVENIMRQTNESFDIPDSLKSRSGALVFLSMGSFGCANLRLMTRVTSILGNSRHRFLVSMGPLHDRYSLPANMWGQRFVPQTAILPLVDVVVTHGGNNTVTESFYYGKPMVVLPLFGDQYDNAQRLQELGLGLRLNPFYCTEEELIGSVDQLVADRQLRQRMKAIGERIRKTDDKSRVSDLIEKIAQK